MKKILKRFFNRLRLAVELTVLAFLIYTFLRTVFGVRIDLGGGYYGWLSMSIFHSNYVLWFFDYSTFDEIVRLNYVYYIIEISLLVSPTIIIAVLEVFKHRAKLFKNYTSYKQRKVEKKLQRYEEKLKELKKGE